MNMQSGCRRCGNMMGCVPRGCRFFYHPDSKRPEKGILRFVDTSVGKAYTKLKSRALGLDQKLSSDQSTFVPLSVEERKKVTESAEFKDSAKKVNNDLHELTNDYLSSRPTVLFRANEDTTGYALLDTGSVGKVGNYISEKCAKQLGVQPYDIVEYSGRTCSVNGCSVVKGIVKLTVTLRHRETTVTTTQFFGIHPELNEMMIIGYLTITELDLTSIFRSLFVNEQKRDLNTMEGIDDSFDFGNTTRDGTGDCSHGMCQHFCDCSRTEIYSSDGRRSYPDPSNAKNAVNLANLQYGKEVHVANGFQYKYNEEVIDSILYDSELENEIYTFFERVPSSDILVGSNDNDHIDEFVGDVLTDQLSQATRDVVNEYEKVHFEGSEIFCKNGRKLIQQYKEQFSTKLQREPAKIVPFKLELIPGNKWFTERVNRQSARQVQGKRLAALEEFITNAIQIKMIEVCNAPAWSHVLMVPKADGLWRFVIDFRQLNKWSKESGWPIPNIWNMLTRIGEKKPKFFAIFDLTQGYFQVVISEDSRHLTAFRTPSGIYQWTRLPMGLKGAPAHFQKEMQLTVLGPLLGTICEVYLDDIIVWGKSEEDLLQNVETFLKRCKECNITVNPKKVKIGMQSVEYVGHTISKDGLHFSEKKRFQVFQAPTPTTEKGMKSFLGLVVQFKSHIHHFSEIVKPLHAMTHGYSPSRLLVWNEERSAAFEKIKEEINNCQRLFFIDEQIPIYLHTDASNYGIGGYLFQQREGEDTQYPIRFISKTLNKTEQRWSTPEKEAYAIFYCLMELEALLRDVHFTLRTDHKNLTYLNSDFRDKVTRWRLAIQSFDFTLEYIKGSENIEADGFSRQLPCSTAETTEDNHQVTNWVMTLAQSPYEDWVEEKVLPDHIVEKIKKVHGDIVGHNGVEITLQRLRGLGLHWQGMRKDISKFIRSCSLCQKQSLQHVKNTAASFTLGDYIPFQRVYIDTIGPLTVSEDGNKYIIVFVDAFSRWVRLYERKDVSAMSAATAMLDWICNYGCPSEIVTDQGTQFVNELIKQMLDVFGIQLIHTTAYSKEENGLVERMNREVKRHLQMLVFERKQKDKWSLILPLAQRIINTRTNSTIGVAPADIVYGNSVQMDAQFLWEASDILKEKGITYCAFLTKLLEGQQELVKIAQTKQFKHDALHMKETENKVISTYPANSYVLVLYKGEGHTPESKLHTKYRGPFKVISNVGDVYTIQDLVTNHCEKCRVELLQPFLYDHTRENPVITAQHDHDYYTVETILKHTPTTRKIINATEIQFLVKWTGFERPEWQRWSPDLAKNIKVHEYLRHHKMARFIPSSFK
jgi:hypothetical protein